MGIFKSLTGVFGQPKVDPKRLVISTHSVEEQDDEIVVDSVTVGSTQATKQDSSNNAHDLNNQLDDNSNDSNDKASFFNDNASANQQLLIESLPELDDEDGLQQLIEAIALEIINNTDRKFNLAEQLSLRLKSHLGVAAPITKQDEANVKLVNFFKVLKTKLNNIGV